MAAWRDICTARGVGEGVTPWVKAKQQICRYDLTGGYACGFRARKSVRMED